MLQNVKFSGELYPLEDDPQVKANLKGRLAVPVYAAIYGELGAAIGVEVLAGAAGVEGSIKVIPEVRIDGEGGINFDAGYESGGFSFTADAYALGKLVATVDVVLGAEIYGLWHLLSHTWTYKVGGLKEEILPELKVTLGKIGYSRDGTITWPSLSQIKPDPPELSPLEMIKKMLSRGKTDKVDQPPPRDYVGNKI